MPGVPRLKEIINVATPCRSSTLARNAQQEFAYTSLRTVTPSVEIWYDPDTSPVVIEEDSIFVKSFFAIPDEGSKSKLHLQPSRLLRLDHAKGIDRELTVHYVASGVAESCKGDPFRHME